MADLDLEVPMQVSTGSQASSCGDMQVHAFLSSFQSSIRLPVQFHRDPVAFSRGPQGCHTSMCFRLGYLGVTVGDSACGIRFYL